MQIGIFMVIAIFFSCIVVIGSSYLEKDKNVYEKIIADILPQINCGACGYGNCANMVEKIIEDKENILKCRPLKQEIKDKFLNDDYE